MTSQEKYRKAIADRPTNEELKYWATLEHRADEIQKKVFDADLEERNDRFKIWFEEYKRQRVCMSNGVEFMDWKKQFDESVRIMSSLDPDKIQINVLLACFEADEQAGVAALKYVQENEPEIPDPEMVEQQAQARKWMDDMEKADQLHRARIEAVRCGLMYDGD
jgi:hypothetical protein